MIAEAVAPLLSLAVLWLSSCGTLVALVIPDEGLDGPVEDPAWPEDDSRLDGERRAAFEAHFERDLRASVRGSDCASGPAYAVVRADFEGDEYLGFCDGRIIRRPAAGGLVVTHLDGRLALAQPRGWRRLQFRLAGQSVSTFVPAAARVRAVTHGDRVRLLGKGFDLWVAPGRPGGPVAPRDCRLVVVDSRFFICRRGRAHQVGVHVPLGDRVIAAESEPQLRASPREAERMVRSAQLLHWVRS